MADLNKHDLDNYITGHFGEDQFKYQGDEEPEGKDFGVEKLLQAIIDMPPNTADAMERIKAIARQALKELTT